MIGALIQIAITLIIVGVIYWAYTQLIGLVPLPAQIATVVRVIVVVILVLVVVFYGVLPLINILAAALPAGRHF